MPNNSQPILFDILIPGTADGWPSASEAIGWPLESALQDAVSRPAVAALVDELAMMPEEARKDRVRSFESSDPTDFDHIYASLLAVYYGSPQVAQKVRYVAESGPREVSPHFERSLIRKVAETDAGRRRL